MNRCIAGALVSTFLIVMILTAMAELNSHRHPSAGRVVVGAVSTESLAVPEGMNLSKVKGSFKYKSESEEDAQQMWIIAGDVPTSNKTFDTVTQFNVKAQEPGTPYGIDHTFYKNSEGVKGRNGDRIKQKFIYYSANTRSEEHRRFPSYGFFKAKIKNGRMNYMYSIKKANQGDMLIGMEDYEALHDGMKDEKPYKESGVPFECALGVDGETHGTDGSISFKATKSKGKGSVD
jgi:hypothetical protein